MIEELTVDSSLNVPGTAQILEAIRMLTKEHNNLLRILPPNIVDNGESRKILMKMKTNTWDPNDR